MGYIVVDGIDGSGKSSVCRALSNLAVADNFTVESLSEPGGSGVALELREVFKKMRNVEKIHPLAEAMIVSAARIQLMTRRVLPALKAGELVICDRNFQSTLAMQAWAHFRQSGDAVVRDAVIETVRQTILACPWAVPEYTAIIDVPVEVALERIGSRGDMDRLESQGEEMMRYRREGYIAHDALLSYPNSPVKIYNGTLPVEETALAIWNDYKNSIMGSANQ